MPQQSMERIIVTMVPVLLVSKSTCGVKPASWKMESTRERIVDSLYIRTKGSYLKCEMSMTECSEAVGMDSSASG